MFRPLIMPGICAHHAMFTISSPYTQLSPSDLDSEIIPFMYQYQDLPRFPLSTLSTASCHIPSPFLGALEMAVVILFFVGRPGCLVRLLTARITAGKHGSKQTCLPMQHFSFDETLDSFANLQL